MTFPSKHTARIGSLLICTTLACSGALAQTTERPDLEGIRTNASLTTLKAGDRDTGGEYLGFLRGHNKRFNSASAIEAG